MRRLSPRFFKNPVVLITSTPGRDAAGGTTRTSSAGTPYRVSVQPNSTGRQTILGALYAETTHVVLWRDFPVDTSAGARVAAASQRLGPEANVQDLLLWTTPAGTVPATIRLQVLGPAIDQGGSGVGWILACKVIT
jgi:hypothetical protein